MTRAASTLATGRAVVVALQVLAWRVPEWWLWVGVLVTWVAIVIGFVGASTPPVHGGHLHQPAAATPPGGVAVEVTCVLAMMVPLVLPTLRRVAFASLWSRRHRAMLVCLSGYLTLWIACSLVLATIVEALLAVVGSTATIGLVAATALLWQLTDAKRAALRGCHVLLPLAPSGWTAERDCFGLGVVVSWSCVINCWALMAVVVAAGHHPLVMLAALVALAAERFGRSVFRDVAIALQTELRVARASFRQKLAAADVRPRTEPNSGASTALTTSG